MKTVLITSILFNPLHKCMWLSLCVCVCGGGGGGCAFVCASVNYYAIATCLYIENQVSLGILC